MEWKLIYKDGQVCNLLQTEGKIYTRKTVYAGINQEECFSKIDELQLNYTYYSGGTTEIIFSGGTRTIEDINDL